MRTQITALDVAGAGGQPDFPMSIFTLGTIVETWEANGMAVRMLQPTEPDED